MRFSEDLINLFQELDFLFGEIDLYFDKNKSKAVKARKKAKKLLRDLSPQDKEQYFSDCWKQK